MPVSGNAVALKVDGTDCAVEALSLRDAIGERFRGQIVVSGDTRVPKDLLGKAFALTITDAHGAKLEVAGIVSEVLARGAGDTQLLELTLAPDCEVLAHGQDSRAFLAMSATDIAKKVIADASLDGGWNKLAGAPAVRPTTRQRHESDWDFLDRLMRSEGAWSWFDHEASSALRYSDDSTAVQKSLDLLHMIEGGLVPNGPWVRDVRARSVLVTDSVELRDRDFLKPALKLDAKAGKDGLLARYDFPGRFLQPNDGTARAGWALDELGARSVVVTGASGSVGIGAGKRFAITDGAVSDAYRDLFCIAVEIANERSTIRVRWTAVPATTKFRLPLRRFAREPLGADVGVVTGGAQQEIAADKDGRVIVQPSWDRLGKKDDKAAEPQRVGQMSLERSMAIPRVGWSVLMTHHDDDVDRPFVLARFEDGATPPSHALPDNMTRTVWHTPTSPGGGSFSELYFEDKKDAEQISLIAAKDMKVTIGDNEARTVGNRHVLEVDKDRSEKTGADEKLTVVKDQSWTVKGAEAMTVEGSRSITVKGKEEASVGGSRTEKVKKARTVDVGGARKLTVTGAVTSSTKKGLTREVLKKLSATAGGAWSTEAKDGGLQITTKGDASETIGGAVTVDGKNGVETLVKGDLSESVGAAYAVTSQGNVGEAAKGKLKMTIGGVLSGVAPSVEISAESEISIVCGAATITIKSSAVEVKGPALAIAGPMVTASGATVKHNP